MELVLPFVIETVCMSWVCLVVDSSVYCLVLLVFGDLGLVLMSWSSSYTGVYVVIDFGVGYKKTLFIQKIKNKKIIMKRYFFFSPNSCIPSIHLYWRIEQKLWWIKKILVKKNNAKVKGTYTERTKKKKKKTTFRICIRKVLSIRRCICKAICSILWGEGGKWEMLFPSSPLDLTL